MCLRYLDIHNDHVIDTTFEPGLGYYRELWSSRICSFGFRHRRRQSSGVAVHKDPKILRKGKTKKKYDFLFQRSND